MQIAAELNGGRSSGEFASRASAMLPRPGGRRVIREQIREQFAPAANDLHTETESMM